jgi:hypothetical protein
MFSKAYSALQLYTSPTMALTSTLLPPPHPTPPFSLVLKLGLRPPGKEGELVECVADRNINDKR